ncbi:MAG: 4Fe-4S dicluster domain-containing protein [Persicimonas sp.]
MTFVITEPCHGTCDTSCVEVCPVDCIHGPLSVDEIEQIKLEGDQARLDDIQLYIDPIICIDCGACEPECPVEAIFEEWDVPEEWEEYIDKNAEFFQ